jgi:hypothetical protein
VKAKRFIGADDDNREVVHKTEENPYLECMCGNILRGRMNSSLSFFTKRSFWSNETIKLLASTADKDRQAHARNHCNAEGCIFADSIPLNKREEIFDPLQLNDKQPDCITLDMTEYLKDIGTNTSYDAFILYLTGRQYYGKYT